MRFWWTLLTALTTVALLAPAAAFGQDGLTGDDQYLFEPFGHDDARVIDVGDFDGDGVGDLATTFSDSTYARRHVRVVSGRREGGDAGPEATAARSYRIDGSVAAASAVGDVDGDGLDDVAVPRWSGVTIVFGRRGTGTVDAEDPGRAGYRITAAGFSPLEYSQNASAVGVGDQNGDGRADVAIPVEDTVRVVLTPADPAGRTVDASSAGPGTAILRLPSQGWEVPYAKIAAVGDLDGDGRQDIAAGQTLRGGGAHAFVALTPPPGTDSGFEAARQAGRAVEFRAARGSLETLVAAGDHGGDERDDIALVVTGAERGRHMVGAFTPAMGSVVDLDAIPPGWSERGYDLTYVNPDVKPIGDHDGDGRTDLAWGSVVLFMSPAGGSLEIRNDKYFYQCCNYLEVAAGTADRNGDGRSELVVAENIPVGDGPSSPQFRRQTRIGVHYSERVLVHESTAAPVDLGDRLRFEATFADPPGVERADEVRGTMIVQVRDREGAPEHNLWGGTFTLTGPGPLRVHLEFPDPFVPVMRRGRTYEFRTSLTQTFGRREYGPWRQLSLGGEPAGPPTPRPRGETPPPEAQDRRAPAVQLYVPARSHRAKAWRIVRGTAADERGGSGLARVQVGLVRVARRCRAYNGRRFSRGRACAAARGRMVRVAVRSGRWRLRVRGMRPGRYELRVRGADRAGNVALAPLRRLRLR